MKVVWSPRARQDLIEIFDHIADRDMAAADTVMERLEAVALFLAEHPRIGRPGRVFGTRELVISGLPYVLPYRVAADRVEIIRALHSARSWPDDFDS